LIQTGNTGVHITPWAPSRIRVPNHRPVPSPTRDQCRKRQTSPSSRPAVFLKPIQFGLLLNSAVEVMDKGCLINVEVRIETRNKRQESGFGSMPAAPAWAWPLQRRLDGQGRRGDETVRHGTWSSWQSISRTIRDTPSTSSSSSPGNTTHLAKIIQQKQKLPEPIPVLAQLVAASPLDRGPA